jgi:hypothetical protein
MGLLPGVHKPLRARQLPVLLPLLLACLAGLVVGPLLLVLGPLLSLLGFLFALQCRPLVVGGFGRLDLELGRVLVGAVAFPQRPGRQTDRHRRAHQQGRCHRRPQSRHDRVAPAPAPGPLPLPYGPCCDRLARLEAAQVLGQLQGAGVALGRLLLQALVANRLQVCGHPRL